MVVCICFLYEPEAQTLIEAKCTVVLKSEGQTHSLSLPVRPFYYVSQHGGTNASILMTQLNLNLADFYDVGTLEYLDHANPNSVHFYERDVPEFPALGTLPHVPSFVPAAPCGAKQLLVNVAAQLIEPSFIGRQCSLQTNPHALTIAASRTISFEIVLNNKPGRIVDDSVVETCTMRKHCVVVRKDAKE